MSEQPALDEMRDALLAYLAAELDAPAIGYRRAPTPIDGGYDAKVFDLQMTGCGRRMSGPLVLRLFPDGFEADRVRRTSMVQNLLAERGQPVPEVHVFCTDGTVIGRSFVLMDRVDGVSAVAGSYWNVPEILGRAHAALHDIESGPFLSALARGGFRPEECLLGAHLSRLRERIEHDHEWLGEAMDWLHQNHPEPPLLMSICHGDFHPLNVLVDGQSVTGIVDWDGFMVADPALDVACTLVLMAVPLRRLAPQVNVERLIERYLTAYRDMRDVDLANIEYYKALRCIQALQEGAEGQQPWQDGQIAAELSIMVREMTGVDFD